MKRPIAAIITLCWVVILVACGASEPTTQQAEIKPTSTPTSIPTPVPTQTPETLPEKLETEVPLLPPPDTFPIQMVSVPPEQVLTGLAEIKRIAENIENSVIIIDVSTQTLWHWKNHQVRKKYSLSTGRGAFDWATQKQTYIGNELNSRRAPTGYMFTLGEKSYACEIDELADKGGCWGWPAFTDQQSDEYVWARVTSGIIPLYSGERKNRSVVERDIYIHGTNVYESVMSQEPRSEGCIRMLPKDLIDLVKNLDQGVNQIYVLERDWEEPK
jgi:lipoprotein-anchoring transpeptidase ErfK/SrfK